MKNEIAQLVEFDRGDTWQVICSDSTRHDAVDALAGLGRWWFERASCRLCFSPVAAGLLGVGACATVDNLLGLASAEDSDNLRRAFERLAMAPQAVAVEFRLIGHLEGARWLRLASVAGIDGAIATGLLTDITAAKQAQMREHFNFAVTQYLTGTGTFDETIHKIIHLVCDELGWEWGAFWAVSRNDDDVEALQCRHFWQSPDHALAPLGDATTNAFVEYGDGPVGAVWRSGQAQWVDATQPNTDPRVRWARACALRSGYFFPVTSVAPDGTLHHAGVLEFFSIAPRQHGAQLPGLAESLSALIAQTAQRMVQQERVRVLAQTDAMTGLFNRTHFHHRVDGACGADAPFALLYIDLDQFKPINDAFGHAAGNAVLCQFADRLQALAPDGAVVARLGGDEFAVIVDAADGQAALDALAQQVLAAARARFHFIGHELSVSASIGISLFPQHGTTAAQLIDAADAAMYLSKGNGRNAVSYYGAACEVVQSTLTRQLMLLSELQGALDRNEFFLEYQPICDTQACTIVAVEALIRWRRADGSVVRPDQFIPVAEQSRMIVPLGRWVLEQVCRDLPRMQAAGMRTIQVHVNMAAPEFLNEDLPQELLAIVSAAQVDPRCLCLELTEGVVMRHIDKSLSIMHELTRLGFSISLDDFGMGYSSLSMLKAFPIKSLKIDRSFLTGIPGQRDDCAIVRTILDLGQNMAKCVIAEGIETDAQLAFLRQFGCPLVQGYLLGRPMGLPDLIERHAPAATPVLQLSSESSNES